MNGHDRTVVFRPFRFNLRTRQLFKDDRPVRLHPQPAKVLSLLVRRAGELVTREEIQHEIWGNDTFVDFDLGINSCIRQLRAALDDDAEHPRFIETVPKQGYSFVAELTDQGGTRATETMQLGRRPFAAHTRSLVVLGGGAALAVTIIVAVLVSYPTNPLAPERESPSTVVLTRRITDMPGDKAYPSLSPNGEWIAFAGLTAGNWDIYLQDVGGRNPINLTSDFPGVDDQPAFSPDGSQIAFRSERDGGGIFVMGRTGESVRRLTPKAPSDMLGAFGFNPTWSPDGRTIAFATADEYSAMSRGINYGELWAVDVVTGECRRLQQAEAVQPQWSPHGHRIAFWSKTQGTEQGDIWTIAAEGGALVRTTKDPSNDWNPGWSAQGNYIYFLSDRGGSPNLWRLAVDERSGAIVGRAQAVTQGEAASRNHLSISSRGGKVAYLVSSVFRNLQQVAFDPATAQVAGEPDWITEGSTHRWSPTPSPNGRWLAYVQLEEEERWLYVSRADGSAPLKLTRGFLPNWSPDSERIAFTSTATGSREIWLIDRDGTDLEQLTNSPNELLGSPVWSPDGSRIAGLNITNHNAFLFEPDEAWGATPPVVLPSESPAGDHLVIRSWSSDGRFLLGGWPFDHGGKTGVGVYDFSTERYETLVDFHTRSSRWLSDGRRFIFASMGPEAAAEVTFSPTKLFLGERLTGEHHEILDVAPDAILPGLGISSDDRTIYFAREHREADIWLLQLETDPK